MRADRPAQRRVVVEGAARGIMGYFLSTAAFDVPAASSSPAAHTSPQSAVVLDARRARLDDHERAALLLAERRELGASGPAAADGSTAAVGGPPPTRGAGAAARPGFCCCHMPSAVAPPTTALMVAAETALTFFAVPGEKSKWATIWFEGKVRLPLPYLWFDASMPAEANACSWCGPATAC